MPSFPFLFINHLEQVLLYVTGFGLSDLFVKNMKFTDYQAFLYYIALGFVYLILMYNTMSYD
jgi:hypothetical protein